MFITREKFLPNFNQFFWDSPDHTPNKKAVPRMKDGLLLMALRPLRQAQGPQGPQGLA